MDQPTRVIATGVAAFLLAAALYWLAIEFRPDGILGVLQNVLAPIYVLPYLMAGGLGGDVHSPRGSFFFIGLFFEAYLVVLAVLWLLILVSRRLSSR